MEGNAFSICDIVGLPPPRSNFSHSHIANKQFNYFGFTFESYVGILLKLQHKESLIRTDNTDDEQKRRFSLGSKNPDYVLIDEGKYKQMIEVKSGRTPSNGYKQFKYLSELEIPLHLVYYPSNRNASTVVKRLKKQNIDVTSSSFQDLSLASFFKGTHLHSLMSDKKLYDSFIENHNAHQLDKYVNSLYNYVSSSDSINLVEVAELLNKTARYNLITSE